MVNIKKELQDMAKLWPSHNVKAIVKLWDNYNRTKKPGYLTTIINEMEQASFHIQKQQDVERSTELEFNKKRKLVENELTKMIRGIHSDMQNRIEKIANHIKSAGGTFARFTKKDLEEGIKQLYKGTEKIEWASRLKNNVWEFTAIDDEGDKRNGRISLWLTTKGLNIVIFP